MSIKWDAVACFNGVGPDVLQRLDEAAHSHIYQAGSTIFNEEEACAGFHIVTEGLVRIYRISPEGRLHTLSLLRPIASFNEVAAVDGGYNPYNAVAVTYSTIVKISHHQLMELLASERELLQNYVQALAHVNREYIERLEDMTFRTIPSRLAKLFLHETTYADQISDAPTKLTQEEIASILGTTREVVGRALRGLLNTGLLRKEGRKVYIADRAGLEHLAETNDMPQYIEKQKT
ncbi:MAG: Crp/Fnr family transcriptional regulator [Anaerolineae bacterium]|nr:Crp/Fnr family transcriptional regulator [Anaerolineae bacterium]MDQ7033517.1 Crp/Fnr family transcriptional regulator [Anaerolineae bacterium]